MRHYTEVLYKQQIKKAKAQYNHHKSHAKQRGIEFYFTFDDWITWWLSTGYYLERGVGKNKYVMSRIGDSGPYRLDNVFCQTHSANCVERNRLTKPETRAKLSSIKKKAVLTPDGEFESITDAAEFYGITQQSMSERIQKHPEKYQRIPKGVV